MPLIVYDTEKHLLDMGEMDATHIDFIKQVNALESMTGEELQAGFHNLLNHTVRHFTREDELMIECGFPQIAEHQAEHRKVLAEMQRYESQLAEGKSSFARVYVRERLPQWFELHLATMDSALVWHLKQYEESTRQGAAHAI